MNNAALISAEISWSPAGFRESALLSMQKVFTELLSGAATEKEKSFLWGWQNVCILVKP